MKLKATFLGTGSSWGVPVIGCPCEVCHSSDLKNKRFRSSLLLEVEGKKIVIDAGPDFRMQALSTGIYHLDGVIFTHSHQDHVAGIDDLRIFSVKTKKPLLCLTSKESADDLRKRYFFMFQTQSFESAFGPRLELISLEKRSGEVDFLGIPIRYFSYEQVGMQVLGIKIGSFAYVTDLKYYQDDLINELKGVDTLVVSALRFTQSHMHLTVDDAVDLIHKVGAKQAYLTHISHEIDHEKANACLPSSIEFAYDGLQIIFADDK